MNYDDNMARSEQNQAMRRNPFSERRRPHFQGVARLLIAVTLGWIMFVLETTSPVSAAPPNWGERKAVTFSELQNRFAEPDMIYAPFMFWFWDEPLNPAKAAEMSRMMIQQRMNPGYVHPRLSLLSRPHPPGVPNEQWLSPLWFDSFEAALKPAEQSGTYLGFCDEYWWPSLRANGRVLEAHPELKAESLKWETLEVRAGQTGQVPSSFFAVAARLDQPLEKEKQKLPEVSLGKWIWTKSAASRQTLYFRKTFELPPDAKVASARIKIATDDHFKLFLNGNEIGRGDDWSELFEFDLTAKLSGGSHVLAVEGRNDDGPAGMLLGFRIEMSNAPTLEIKSDASWDVRAEPSPGWDTAVVTADGWFKATELEPVDGPTWRLAADGDFHKVRAIRSATIRLIGAGESFQWTAPNEGDWRVYAFNKYYHGSHIGGNVNYLDERLANAFIKIALEPYEKRLGDRLGKSVPGDFVDNEGDYGHKLAWSDSLDETYRRRFGRDIRLILPMLADEDVEGVYAKARWEWFEIVSDLYTANMGAVVEWNKRRGMYTIANFWEENLVQQADTVGDFMKILRAYTMPGNDCLGFTALHVHDFKEVASVSEFESRRCMSEIMGAPSVFGGKPWSNFTPPTLKRCLNAVTAWGISHVVAHGLFMERRLERNPWVPDWYTENPLFSYLHLWNDFARRASYVNSHGHQAAQVLLLNPMDSVWANTGAQLFDASDRRGRSPQARRAEEINQVYSRAINELTDARIEFLVTDRHYLNQMKVRRGKLVRDELAFHTVILPPLDILPQECVRRLVSFAKAGGRIYALGELPTGSSERGMNDPEMTKLVNSLRQQVSFKSCPNGLRAELNAKAPGLTSEIEFKSGAFPMLQRHVRIEGRDFFWLVNNSEKDQECALRIAGIKGGATIWDCESGKRRSIWSRDGDSGSEVLLYFKPLEAFWLVFDPKTKTFEAQPEARPETKEVATIQGPWKITINPQVQPELEKSVALTSLPANLDAKHSLADWKDWGMERFVGFVDYASEVVLDKPDASLQLDLGQVFHVAEVWVNDQQVGRKLWGPFVFDVSGQFHSGTNSVRIRVGNLVNNAYGDIQPSGLIGPVTLRR